MSRPHVLSVAGLLLIFACAEDAQLLEGVPQVALESEILDFGVVYVGGLARQTTFITESGRASVEYEARFLGPAPGFVVGPRAQDLRPLQKQEVVVQFVPERPGPVDAEVLFDFEEPTEDLLLRVRAQALLPPDCEDGNPCTDDTFEFTEERCVHQVHTRSCDDGDLCTENGICIEGICIGSQADCDDNSTCTDDACSPTLGCVYVTASECDDQNPCTQETCSEEDGCGHEDLPNGTPCDDSEPCTFADICIFGSCVGVTIPEGSDCDDGDPCSQDEVCTQGECLDPNYFAASFGEIKFETQIPQSTPGGRENPLIDRNGTVYVGLSSGVGAVDQCGAQVWTTTVAEALDFGRAVLGTTHISVPEFSGPRLFDFDRTTGRLSRTLDLASLFSGTSSLSATITDLALRSSEARVASLTTTSTNGQESLLVEIDPQLSTFAVLERFDGFEIIRIVIDEDESVTALFRDDQDRRGLARFGVQGLETGTWSTIPVESFGNQLALGQQGEALWTHGLVSVDRLGRIGFYHPPSGGRDPFSSITPVVGRDWTLHGTETTTVTLTAYTSSAASAWSQGLSSTPVAHPVIDVLGNSFHLTDRATLLGLNGRGETILNGSIPSAAENGLTTLTLTPDGVLVYVRDTTIVGIRLLTGLNAGSWPRYRGDNLSTGHR